MDISIRHITFIKKFITFLILVILFLLLCAEKNYPQLYEIETNHLRLVYYGVANKYLVKYVGQCFENALKKNSELYDYEPAEKTTVLVEDLNDVGNAGTGTVPHNHIILSIAPLNFEYETSPANERINTTFNHELVHQVTLDQATSDDNFFRTIFGGKVNESSDDPLSMIYAYLTVPRRSTPRWFKEGIAVFLETWMAGGIGRSTGGYDEMVFRTIIQEHKHIFVLLAFESEGTHIDFQVGANSYLYGTRFMNYLALVFGPEKLIEWTSRHNGSDAYFISDFERIYKLPMDKAWKDWIKFENEFQEENLEIISLNPVTKFRPLSKRALGAFSRAFYDHAQHKIYAAIDFPGQISQIASIDLKTGSIERIHDVKGAALYYVTSLAYDSSSKDLFYTTDNNDWRSIYELNIKSGDSKLLLKEARIGDLVFNDSDKSLWGIRHFNGISTIVRIPYPYTEWNQIYSWEYGHDMYNIDISPDGKYLTGALAEISGQQLLISMKIQNLFDGNFSYDTLFNFENTIPANFIFSKDGKYLYGSSYYSGVSNVYKYDFRKKDMFIMSNCETGYFRPLPISADSLLVLKYTTEGFLPVMIANEQAENVKAINLMGVKVIEKHPVLAKWIAPPPSSVNLDTMIIYEGNYNTLTHLNFSSFYPVVEGYKDYLAYGLRFNLAGDIGFQSLDFTVSYSPYKILHANERLHLKFDYSYLNWKFESTLNRADFYDLFGPTKVSRKGYSAGITFKKNLVYDNPRKMDYTIHTTWYGNLERLPDYQNVKASYDKLLNVGLSYSYQDMRASLGAVDYEKGFKWDVVSSNNYVSKRIVPLIHTDFNYGIPLALNHSSIWLRASTGTSFGTPDDPFANFYFGGFGNNWIDNQHEKQYRNFYCFPGAELNYINGKNFGKILLEWNIPPLRFSDFGFPSFFLTWMRPALFTSGIFTNIGSPDIQRKLADFGGQLDFKIIFMSHLQATLSLGYAAAVEKAKHLSNEFMISLKIL